MGVEGSGAGAQPLKRLPGKGAKRRETQKMVPSPLTPPPHGPKFHGASLAQIPTPGPASLKQIGCKRQSMADEGVEGDGEDRAAQRGCALSTAPGALRPFARLAAHSARRDPPRRSHRSIQKVALPAIERIMEGSTAACAPGVGGILDVGEVGMDVALTTSLAKSSERTAVQHRMHIALHSRGFLTMTMLPEATAKSGLGLAVFAAEPRGRRFSPPNLGG